MFSAASSASYAAGKAVTHSSKSERHLLQLHMAHKSCSEPYEYMLLSQIPSDFWKPEGKVG